MTDDAPTPRWLVATWALRVAACLAVYAFGWWWYLNGDDPNDYFLGRLRFFLWAGPLVLPFLFWFDWLWLRKNADRVNGLGFRRRR